MTKERTNISIEKELLENAKKYIPNLSAFFEECLKHYLGYADGTMPIVSDLEILDKIGKLQVKLFILNENFDAEENRRNAKTETKNRTWRFLWNDYLTRLIPDERLLSEAEETLQMNSETLEDLLDELYEVKEEVDTEKWSTVYEWYTVEVE